MQQLSLFPPTTCFTCKVPYNGLKPAPRALFFIVEKTHQNNSRYHRRLVQEMILLAQMLVVSSLGLSKVPTTHIFTSADFQNVTKPAENAC